MGLRDWLPFGKGKDKQPKDYDSKAGIGKVDTEAARIVNEGQLEDHGVSKDMIKLLRKHGHPLTAQAVIEQMTKLNHDLEYEGFDKVPSVEIMIRVIIAHKSLEQNRKLQLEQAEKKLKATAPNSPAWETAFHAQSKMPPTPSIQQLALMLQAEQLLKADKDKEPITDNEIDEVVSRLKRQAYSKKANRLAHSEAQFLLKNAGRPNFKARDEFGVQAVELRQKYKEEIPKAEVAELARQIFVAYKTKNPFKG